MLNNNSLFDIFVDICDWIYRFFKKKYLFFVRFVYSLSLVNK